MPTIQSLFSVESKRVLITGANGLIGRALCETLIENDACVIAVDINLNNLAPLSSHPKFFGLKSDITDQEELQNIFRYADEHLQGIDVLVNLAAIDAKADNLDKDTVRGEFTSFPFDELQRSFDVNVMALIRLSQFAVETMLKGTGGQIINIASTYSLVSPNQQLYRDANGDQTMIKPVDYVASKSAIPNFTRYLATLYAKDNIRANCMVPHAIVANPDSNFIREFKRLSPIGRPCDLQEIVGPLLFMISDASSYMTGSTMVVDGGWTAW